MRFSRHYRDHAGFICDLISVVYASSASCDDLVSLKLRVMDVILDAAVRRDAYQMDMAVDIQMGANAGTSTCGVTWGNGTKDELEEAGATFIIDRIEDLIEIVNK